MTNDTLYKTLYKLNSDGKTIQVWSIHHDEDSYWTVSGKVDGKMIVNERTLCPPKQKRSQLEQVVSVVESQIEKKRRKKYVPNIKDVHSANDNLLGFEAQLAQNYEKHKKKIKFPCIVQAKLDGIRSLTTKDGSFSRGRKEFTSCLHIKEELADFFKANPQARLDGEYYTAEFKEDFEQICRAVKKSAEKAKPEDLALQQKIQYWVYDTPRIGTLTETDKFVDRQKVLAETFKDYKYVKVVETIIVKDEEEMLAYKAKWIQEGFEGIMLRNIDSPYEGKRSYNLQKLKDFMDEEFIILRVNEGQGKLAGHAGSFTFCRHNNEADLFLEGVDKDIVTFDAKMIGSISRLKYFFEHPEEAVGKLGTIRFQNYTSENIPRFPVCRGIRDYE